MCIRDYITFLFFPSHGLQFPCQLLIIRFDYFAYVQCTQHVRNHKTKTGAAIFIFLYDYRQGDYV